MTNKAYIVANEQQEREVLKKLEWEGLKWKGFSEEPTQWLPTRDIGYIDITFPYILFGDDVVSWCSISELKDIYEIVFDGRKESKMSEKYVVSQEFMSNLKNWKSDLMNYGKPGYFVGYMDIGGLPAHVYDWLGENISNEENNNRLIAILRWVNGEDVFEVESKKWIVRSKEHDEGGHYQYVKAGHFDMSFNEYHIEHATRFDTKEEAESWANSHQEVRELIEEEE